VSLAPVVIRPDWQAPLVERWEWLTDLHVAHDGTESRTPLRAVPRRSVRYRASLGGSGSDFDRLALVDALTWPAGAVLLPVWQDAWRLVKPLAQGATSIVEDQDGPGFAPASGTPPYRWDFEEPRRVILTDGLDAEAVAVTDLASEQIDFAATTRAWPAGARIVPAREGRIVRLERSHPAAALATVVVEVEFSELATAQAALAEATSTQYRGLDVDLRRPDRTGSMRSRWSRVGERLDGEVGVWAFDERWGVPLGAREAEYALTGRDAIWSMLRWLHRVAGRARAFWAPTWQADLRVVAPVSGSPSSITVSPVGYAARYTGAAGRRDVAIWHRPSRTWTLRRIESVSTTSAGEVLTLSGAAPNGEPGDLLVSWLELVRLDSDAVEVAFTSPELARVALGVQRVAVDETEA